MRRCLRFVAPAEVLERRDLLVTYNWDIATFNGPPVLADLASDPSGDTAWGFPGMLMGSQVNMPENAPISYYGIKQVTFTYSMNVLSDLLSFYTTTSGYYTLTSGGTWTAAMGDYTNKTAQYTGACGKNPGVTTITISAQMWIKNGPGNPTTWDTLNDVLTVKIEAPTVNSFQVSDDSGPGVGALQFWFGRSTGYDPNLTGTDLCFGMARGSPRKIDYAAFWANVTNITHYDLRMCFVQIVDTDVSELYTNGTSTTTTGTDELDIVPENVTYHYNDYEMRLG